MKIQRLDGYSDPRFPREVLCQHGAFLVDGAPWSFRIVSDCGAAVHACKMPEEAFQAAVEEFRFYAGHITEFYDEGGRCIMRLPPVERREVEIEVLQPSQFSVDREKCEAVGEFLHSAADLVIPVAQLGDGSLTVLDGHTRLYVAWRRGIRTAAVFESPLDEEQKQQMAGFVREARNRHIFHIADMALYSPEEQKEKWHDWCDAYFAGLQGLAAQ